MLSRFSGVILLQVTKNQFKLGTYMNLLASVSEHFFWLCQVFIMACGLSVEVHSLLQLPSADSRVYGLYRVLLLLLLSRFSHVRFCVTS